MQHSNTKILTAGALMVALSTLLNLFEVAAPWVAGGSITLFSMVPVAFFAFLYGPKWGLLAGASYGALQLLTGLDSFKGVGLVVMVASMLIDYILAYMSLAFAGSFRKLVKNQTLAFAFGCAFVSMLRFLCHFVSGFLLWGSITQDGFGAILYSFTYNMGYMGPEALITVIGGVVLMGALGKTSFVESTNPLQKNA